jgi:ATP-binding cassette subfamily C exporter for protease/lipase
MRWMRLHKRALHEQTRVQEVGARAQALSKFLQYVQQSLILSLGAWLVIRGEITMGAMVATNVLLGNALRPIGTLVGTWKEFVLARQSFNDLAVLLEEHEPAAVQRSAQVVKANIKLKQLSAFAHQREKPILDDITVDFVAGGVVQEYRARENGSHGVQRAQRRRAKEHRSGLRLSEAGRNQDGASAGAALPFGEPGELVVSRGL